MIKREEIKKFNYDTYKKNDSENKGDLKVVFANVTQKVAFLGKCQDNRVILSRKFKSGVSGKQNLYVTSGLAACSVQMILKTKYS